jgi:hypothetical protein
VLLSGKRIHDRRELPDTAAAILEVPLGTGSLSEFPSLKLRGFCGKPVVVAYTLIAAMARGESQ